MTKARHPHRYHHRQNLNFCRILLVESLPELYLEASMCDLTIGLAKHRLWLMVKTGHDHI